MAIAILEYEQSGGPRSFKVRHGQSMRIGASNSSDIQLSDAEHVAPQHCEVTYASGTLAIKNLTDGRRAVHVNGETVNRQRLYHGDQIDIGNNRLRVVLQQTAPSTSASKTPPVPAAVALGAAGVAASASSVSGSGHKTKKQSTNKPDSAQPSKSSPQKRTSSKSVSPEDIDSGKLVILENGLRSVSVEKFNSSILPLVDQSDFDWTMAVLANHRVSQLTEFLPTSPNLLADAPDDIAASNDLYLVQDEARASVLKTFEQFSDRDSAVMLLLKPEKTINEDALKFVATWFMTPVNLKFNLTNGTDLLLEKVFTLVDMVVIRDTADSCDLCLLADETVTDWKSFTCWMTGNSNDANR